MRKMLIMLTAVICVLTQIGVSNAQNYRHELRSLKAKNFINAGAGRAAGSSDLRLLSNVTSLKVEASGYVDTCNKHVVPYIAPVDVGGALGKINAVFVSDEMCFGMAGSDLALVDKHNRLIWDGSAAGVAVLPSTHFGVHDLTFAGPGFRAAVWVWDPKGHRYKFLVSHWIGPK